MRGVLESLPCDQSRAVLLRDVQGLSTQQAAALVGVDEREFRNRLHRGRVTLHAELSRYLTGVAP